MSSTIFFFLFIPLLAFILLAVNLILAPHNPYMEKNSAFECGFSSFLGQNRTQFSISFFIFALLFLLFDLEILLVYPYLVSAYTNGVYGLVIMLMFLLALTLGFAFELGKKALSIDSRQTSNVSANNKSNYINKVKVSPFLQAKSNYTASMPMLSMSPTTGVISIAVFNQIDNLALDILLMFFILFAFLLLSGAIVLLSLFISKCKNIFKSKGS
jgi:NADH-ubiquinone oxidoreductase chain 3